MNKTILTLLFLSASLIASAQFCRKDTTSFYTVGANDVKTPFGRTINCYKSTTNNQLDSYLVQNLFQGAWRTSEKKAYNYANGLKTLEISSRLTNGVWQKEGKQNWTYNTAGKITVYADSTYDPIANNYSLTWTEVSTYDANNNETQQTVSARSQPIRRTNKTYNTANLTTLLVNSESTDGGLTFTVKGETAWTYNASKSILELETKIFNSQTNALVPNLKFIYTYDAKNLTTSEERQRFVSGAWFPDFRQTYTYNSDGLVTVIGMPRYATDFRQWINNRQVLITYADKLKVREDFEQWNLVSSSAYTTTNTFTFAYNAYKRLIFQNSSVLLIPGQAQVPLRRTTYKHNDSADWNEELIEVYNRPTSQFVNQSKTNRIIDSKGNILQFTNSAWIIPSNSWRPNTINNFTFSSSNKLTMQEDLAWDNGNNQLRPNQKRTFEFHPTYDYETANTDQTNFNPVTNKYLNHQRIEFACVNSATQTNSIKTIAKAALKIYPNPNNTGTLNIENAANGVVSIYNTIGQKVMTHNMDETKSSVNISELEKGLYIVILQINGEKLTTKLIVE